MAVLPKHGIMSVVFDIMPDYLSILCFLGLLLLVWQLHIEARQQPSPETLDTICLPNMDPLPHHDLLLPQLQLFPYCLHFLDLL